MIQEKKKIINMSARAETSYVIFATAPQGTGYTVDTVAPALQRAHWVSEELGGQPEVIHVVCSET